MTRRQVTGIKSEQKPDEDDVTCHLAMVSPIVMYQRLDIRVIKRADRSHRGLGQRRQIRRPDVFHDLRRAFRAGNGARHRRKLQNPAQRQLRQRRASGNQSFQLFGHTQAGLKIHARKRFAAVKRLAVPIEVTMVILGEPAVARDFARQQSRGQRHAREDADLALLRLV